MKSYSEIVQICGVIAIEATTELKILAIQHKVVAIIGLRQSSRSTLCKLKHKPEGYVVYEGVGNNFKVTYGN